LPGRAAFLVPVQGVSGAGERHHGRAVLDERRADHRASPPGRARAAGADGVRILHVIPRIGPDQGGLRTGTLAICRAMQRAGMTPEIACLDEDGDDPPGITVHRFAPGLAIIGASIDMRDWLRQHAGDYHAIVAHVVWLNPAHYAAEAAAGAGIPLMLA